LDPNICQEIIKEADINKDGKISLDEYIKLMEKIVGVEVKIKNFIKSNSS
jgi:hypothetical protein